MKNLVLGLMFGFFFSVTLGAQAQLQDPDRSWSEEELSVLSTQLASDDWGDALSELQTGFYSLAKHPIWFANELFALAGSETLERRRTGVGAMQVVLGGLVVESGQDELFGLLRGTEGAELLRRGMQSRDGKVAAGFATVAGMVLHLEPPGTASSRPIWESVLSAAVDQSGDFRLQGQAKVALTRSNDPKGFAALKSLYDVAPDRGVALNLIARWLESAPAEVRRSVEPREEWALTLMETEEYSARSGLAAIRFLKHCECSSPEAERAVSLLLATSGDAEVVIQARSLLASSVFQTAEQ